MSVREPIKQRDSNLELFRIISMLLIIAHHYVVNSGLESSLAAAPTAPKSLFFYLMGAWGKTGINCFLMISGYFMCKAGISLKRFLKLLLEILFYDIVIYLIFALTGYTAFSLSGLVSTLIPVRIIHDGFTSAYIVFFLFIPFFNILLRHLSEKMHVRLMLLTLFLYTFLGTVPGFGVTMNYVSWFMTVYFTAAYIRLYPKALFEKKGLWGLAALTSLGLSVASILLCIKTGRWPYSYVSDSNTLLAFTTAFCAFLFFKNLKMPYIRLINLAAGTAFGVLLIHANSDIMRQWLWKDTLQNSSVFHSGWCYLHFFCVIPGIYLICMGIDLLRQRWLEAPFFRWYEKHSGGLLHQLSSLEQKLLDKLNIH